MSADGLWASISNPAVMKVGLAAFALGALGGLAHVLAARRSASEPEPVLWKQVAIGAVAAIAAIAALAPEDEWTFASVAIIAGFSGQAIMAALETRVLLAISRKEESTLVHERDIAVAAARLLLEDDYASGAKSAVAPGTERADRARALLRTVRSSAPYQGDSR